MANARPPATAGSARKTAPPRSSPLPACDHSSAPRSARRACEGARALAVEEASTRESRCVLRHGRVHAGTPPPAFGPVAGAGVAPSGARRRPPHRGHTARGAGPRPAPAAARLRSPGASGPHARASRRAGARRAWRRTRAVPRPMDGPVGGQPLRRTPWWLALGARRAPRARGDRGLPRGGVPAVPGDGSGPAGLGEHPPCACRGAARRARQRHRGRPDRARACSGRPARRRRGRGALCQPGGGLGGPTRPTLCRGLTGRLAPPGPPSRRRAAWWPGRRRPL
jgi:hypothetical protein